VKDEKGGKVVLLTEKASDWKNNPIKFKISTLSTASSIQIGACLKTPVAQKLYKFDSIFTINQNQTFNMDILLDHRMASSILTMIKLAIIRNGPLISKPGMKSASKSTKRTTS
jgi:hypothetical protein